MILDNFGIALIIVTVLFSVPGVRLSPNLGRLALAALSLAVLWTPWLAGRAPLFYVGGIVTGISVTTQVVLALGLARRFGWRNQLTKPLPRDVGAVLAGTLALLFLSTLGYIQTDLYGWGYRPRALLFAVGILLALVWRRHPGLALAWLAGLAAFAIDLSPSINLWDSLGDPVLMLGGLWRALISDRNLAPTLSATDEPSEVPPLAA